MQSIKDKILSRIYYHMRGSVVVANQFLDLGTRSAVGTALHRLARQE